MRAKFRYFYYYKIVKWGLSRNRINVEHMFLRGLTSSSGRWFVAFDSSSSWSLSKHESTENDMHCMLNDERFMFWDVVLIYLNISRSFFPFSHIITRRTRFQPVEPFESAWEVVRGLQDTNRVTEVDCHRRSNSGNVFNSRNRETSTSEIHELKSIKNVRQTTPKLDFSICKTAQHRRCKNNEFPSLMKISHFSLLHNGLNS